MSEINLTITPNVQTTQIVVNESTLQFTPNDIQLNVISSGFSSPGGNLYEIQYNAGGFLAGIPYAEYSNITGNLTLGNISNIKITGGTNGYVLQTDGTGNLTWTAQTGGGGGNGNPGGANTQIQYNDSGIFGGNAGFTFDEITGDVNIPNTVISTAGNIGNTIINNTGIVTPGIFGDITGANLITSLNLNVSTSVTLAPNISISANSNPNAATGGNTAATFKYPITINGNLYYLNLTANI